MFSFFRHVSKRIRYQPVRMVWGVVTTAIVIGLLSIINAAAANALFSLTVAGNDLAWMVPILCRLTWGRDRFVPGVFYTGRLSKPIAITAVIYLTFAIVLSMFPTLGPDPSRMSSLTFSGPFLRLYVLTDLFFPRISS